MSDEIVVSRRSPHPLVVVIVLLLVAMWGYVLYLAFFVGRAESPDKIDAADFTAAAEQRCAVALAAVADLPSAETQADDPRARSETLEEATATFESMVADLRLMPVPDPADAKLVELWLDDWEVLLADRYDYAARVRVDDEARLLLTPGPGGRQVTLRIDEFAATNDMPSCESPLDA